MPFKLRVGKRTGRYDLSRDLYVIAVQLLDGNLLQCTLSTDSTGKDCMDYICQRLELQQNIFFGLRYKCARMIYRWVELDKPLRKQLEKTAQEMKLFFGVMFHTPNAASLTDPMARYCYFLQMRSDVLDGRLLVSSPEKAILLASYSLQIDFGDHEETKVTVETLLRTPVLPRHITQSSEVLEDLNKQAIVGYNALRGLSRAQAEALYITEAQQCDDYREEYFPGKDEDGSDVFIRYCMEGIVVKRLQGPPVKYKWEEIVSIMASRRNLIVNCAELAHAHFQMEDVETAKYAAYVCGLHLQFFRNFCKREDGNLLANRSTSLSGVPALPFHKFSPQAEQQGHVNIPPTSGLVPFPSMLEIQQQHQLMAGVRPVGRFVNGFPDTTSMQQLYLGAGHGYAAPPLPRQALFSHSTTSIDRLSTAAFRVDSQMEPLPQDATTGDVGLAAVPMQSINSPLNPSVSSLSSAAGIYPMQQQQQQRMLPNLFPNRQQGRLQSWMSQQVLAASTSTSSLNRSPMSAFNGSIPHIHAIGGHFLAPQLNPPRIPPAATHARLRLFNGPGRPLSLDEFNLNEMLRTAYEHQQMQRQQPVSPNRQHLVHQQRPFIPANSEQSLPLSADFANGRAATPMFRGPHPAVHSGLNLPAPATHPGMQYLADLEAFLHAHGGELLSRIPQSPPMPPAINRLNVPKVDEETVDHLPSSATTASNLSKAVGSERPGSAIPASLTCGTNSNDRNFVSTPDLTSMALLKSRGSPELVVRKQNQRQQQHQQKKSIDAKAFENLSVENLDSPTIKRKPAALFRRDSSVRSMDEENEKPKQSQKVQYAVDAVGSPQRIIVGAAASSSGESDEHLDDSSKINGRSNASTGCDVSQSTIATSSTSTLPDDSATGQLAFQRFNPKIYELQLMSFQREQQLQYRQQVQQEQEQVDESASSRKLLAANEHHRSVAILNLKTSEDLAAKERRKSTGEVLGHETDVAATTAHHHRLLVNDHGGSSSEEALKSPCLGVAETAFDQRCLENAPAFNGERSQADCNGAFSPKARLNGGHAPDRIPSPSLNHFGHPGLRQRQVELENGDPMSAVSSRAAVRDGMLKREFELIPKKRVSAGLSTAQRRENQPLNRDLHILPYEDTRVMLRPNKHNPHGYINASHIQIPIGTTLLKYVATQGPLRDTVADFWQMIWESGCRIIVMLTRCVEQGQEQSFPYWPCKATADERQKLKFGEFQLSLHNCTESKTHVTSTLILKHTGIGQKRLVYHLQYLDWPNGGVPGSIDSFMSFVDEVNSVKVHVANEFTKAASSTIFNASRTGSRANLLDNSNHSGSHSSTGSGSGGSGSRKRSTSSQASQPFTSKTSPALEVFGNGNYSYQNQLSTYQAAIGGPESNASDAQLPPVTVHCSLGAGRTGAYLLAEVMIYALQHNQDLDMARALAMLRQKRMLLVETFLQYGFVFTCLTQYMRKSRLI